MINKKNLNFFYIVHQFIYWTIPAGVASFAATFLLDHGYNSLVIGLILFGSCFFSFLFQPILGTYADKAGKNVLPYLMLVLAILSLLSFASIFIFNLSMVAFGVLYMLGNVFIDMQVPLLNSISMYYSLRKWDINYSLARGMGALGYGLGTLFFGEAMQRFGNNIMPIICIGLIIIFGIMSLFYPKDHSKVENNAGNEGEGTTSIFKFMMKYKWYSLSLVGFTLFALFHVMIENFLIIIMTALGGNSSDVGFALFIAAIIEIPTTILFGKIYNKLGAKNVIYIGGIFYVLKGILFIFANSLRMIYVAQMLQCVNYVFVNTVLMFYAKECASSNDMVKSQSIITAFFSLGYALGSLAGGILLETIGIEPMLMIGLGIAITGVLISVLTVNKALKYGKIVAGN